MFDESDKGSGNVIINLEWGAFGDDGSLDFVRTEYDKDVDKNSVNPGRQLYVKLFFLTLTYLSTYYVFRHEKMISGMYMGEIARLAIEKLTKEALIFGGKGSEELFTRGRFYTKYVSEIEAQPENSVTKTQEILEELGICNATEQDCINVRYICQCVSKRAADLVSAGIATLLNKMNEPQVTVAIDGSVYRYHPHFHNLMMETIAQLVNPGITVSIQENIHFSINILF